MTKVNTMKIVFAVVVAITLLLAVVRADHKRVKDELKDVAVIESAERALTMDLLRDEVAHVSNILRRAFLQSLSEIGRDQGKAKLKKKKGPAAKKVITKPKKNLKACKITKPKAPRKKTVYCRTGDRSMTLSKLQEYLRTVTGEVRGRGFIFIPPGQSNVPAARNGILFSSRISTKAEQDVFPGKKSTHVECKLTRMYNMPNHKVREFYMNLSPCTNCAPQLLKAYNGYISSTNPVTIYLSRLWTGPNDDYKKCLAKLIKKGFKLVVANWNSFVVNYLDEQSCQNEAFSYSKKKEFKDQEDILEKAIEDAEALAENTCSSVINGWCPETNSKWCD